MDISKIPPSVLAQYPALAPPAGVASNFIDPPDHNTSLIALNVVFLALMLLVVSIRLYAKSALMHTIGWDDYTCAMAAATSIIHSGLTLDSLNYGYGRHLWDIRAITLLNISHIRIMTASSVVYPFVIFFVKLSILLLYLRIFGVNRLVRVLVYVGLVVLTLFYISYFGVQLATLDLCISQVNNEKYSLCKNEYAILVFQGAFNVFTDLYVFFIPIPRILALQVSKRQKIGLMFILLAGLSACIVSIARMINLAVTFRGPDTFWNAALSTEFTIVEINLAIIASCMSTLPGFFAKIAGSSFYRSMQSRFFSSRSNLSKRSKDTHDPESAAKTGSELSHKSPHNAYIELSGGPGFNPRRPGDVDSTSDNVPLRE